MAKKIVLAYSGGLDTSVCVRWLKDRGYDVIAYVADIGQGEDFKVIKERARIAGASKVCIEDLKTEFVKDFVFPALKANAIYESKYLLATALSRPLIAKGMVCVAKKEHAGFVGHGCTGKGNDQIRFEVTTQILAPHLKTIAPVRLWEFKSRDEEIDYAKRCSIPVGVSRKKPYSIDKNLWGVSIECGVLEDANIEPPEDAYQFTDEPSKTPDAAGYLKLYFDKGIPKKINEKLFEPVELIEEMNRIGAKYGIGRTDLIENRLVGIKSREVYEAPAAWILYLAHKELENLILDRELMHFKEAISLKYAELIYYGLWFSPLKAALDKFVDQTQKNITGTVTVKLYKGTASCVGRDSKYSLYRKELATYTKEDIFDQKLAEGFIKIWGMPYRK